MSQEEQTNENNQTQQAKQPEFTIQRIFIKDASFESPQSPAIFQKDWKPELNMQLHTRSSALAQNLHEVVLQVTVTAKHEEKTVFLAEVHQAGIFALQGFEEQQLQGMLGSVCPSILFPYAREMISNLVTRGTFPPLYLAPVNFEALYLQHLREKQNSSAQTEPGIIQNAEGSIVQ